MSNQIILYYKLPFCTTNLASAFLVFIVQHCAPILARQDGCYFTVPTHQKEPLYTLSFSVYILDIALKIVRTDR